MFGEISNEVLAWCAFALLLGGLVKGVVGVGVPMIAVPLMSLVIPAHYAAALVLLPVIPANLIQMRAGGPLRAKVVRFWPLLLGLCVGTVVGGWWFTQGDPRLIQLTLGLIVCIFLFVRLTRPAMAIPARWERSLGLGVGLFAGGVGGMAMLIGPMVVMYMTALRLSREEFIGAISYIYFVTTLVIAATLAGYSQLNMSLAAASVASCLPVFAGMWLGSRFRHFLHQETFERMLSLLLAVIATSLLFRALS
jgi:uncharacterized membrane protein YfcA